MPAASGQRAVRAPHGTWIRNSAQRYTQTQKADYREMRGSVVHDSHPRDHDPIWLNASAKTPSPMPCRGGHALPQLRSPGSGKIERPRECWPRGWWCGASSITSTARPAVCFESPSGGETCSHGERTLPCALIYFVRFLRRSRFRRFRRLCLFIFLRRFFMTLSRESSSRCGSPSLDSRRRSASASSCASRSGTSAAAASGRIARG